VPGWIVNIPSAFSFPCSSLYLLAHIDARWGTHHIADAHDTALYWLECGLEGIPHHDMLAGSAGVICVLAALAERTGSDDVVRLAARYGELLLRNAVTMPTGIAWKHQLYERPLGGMAHGTAGIALALLKLAAITGREAFLDAASKAIAYDESLYSAAAGGWPDLRGPESAPAQHGWCNGSAGILLSRCTAHALTGRDDLLEQIERATTISLHGKAATDCLCHGSLGIIDAVRTAAKHLGRRDWARRANQWLARTCDGAHERGYWRCGNPEQHVSLPGLFMGLAGIGFGLIRQVQPDLVPSVLTLEGPSVGPRARAPLIAAEAH
jgi:lantibiotic modifying enzyme